MAVPFIVHISTAEVDIKYEVFSNVSQVRHIPGQGLAAQCNILHVTAGMCMCKVQVSLCKGTQMQVRKRAK